MNDLLNELLGVVAGSTPAGELGRVPLRVAQSIKMLSKKNSVET